MIDDSLLERAYKKAEADRWRVPLGVFRAAVEAGVQRSFGNAAPSRRELERYLGTLHLRDLALACACASGDERAWEQFIHEQRPVLYRAADALDRTGAAREIADSLYAELYGLRAVQEGRVRRGSTSLTGAQTVEGGRASLFKYFHGRSSLTTWLRAILVQRYVDRLREDHRVSPIDEEFVPAVAQPDTDRPRFARLIGDALRTAITRLSPKDRLRLRAYYEQQLTLAQVGRLCREHEATVSRQLARIRELLRREIDEQLRRGSHFGAEEIARCWESVMTDPGPLDLSDLFGKDAEPGNLRKKLRADRSK